MKRMNLGCGSVQPEGWINVDGSLETRPVCMYLNVLNPNFDDLAASVGGVDLDYIVCNHMLSDLDWHQLPVALRNIASMLKPGGLLRILVPDALAMFEAYARGDARWFPQSDATPGLEQKFCTMVTWYGSVKSVFTPGYVYELLSDAGFAQSVEVIVGETLLGSPYPGITDLDGDRTTCLVFEGLKL